MALFDLVVASIIFSVVFLFIRDQWTAVKKKAKEATSSK